MSATAPSPLPTRHLPTLDDEVSTDPATVGHKAATLARLRRAGHRVPPALVVPVQLAASLGNGPAADVLPPDIRHELEEAIAVLGVVAVRSSGVVEDRPDASWAGQYEADAAGVAFTANPVTGDDEVLVSAVRGLADRLVAGEVDPEEWAQRPGAPPVRKGGPETVLGPADVAEMAREALRLAAAIGAPVDMEWAISGGLLHVLQAPAHHRPARPARHRTAHPRNLDQGHQPLHRAPHSRRVLAHPRTDRRRRGRDGPDLRPAHRRVQAGEVLVCPITNPAWSVLFGRVGAMVTDAGGALSHAAIVAREHNVPAVLSTVNATTVLRDGQVVTVDGTSGTVEVHGAPVGTVGAEGGTGAGPPR